jgi:magnesium transporter
VHGTALKTSYRIQDGSIVESPSGGNIVAYAAPDEAEKQELTETLGIHRYDLESALDPDEISRVELDPEHLFILWKRPDNVSVSQQLKFEVSSVGIFIKGSRATFIFGEKTIPFLNPQFRKISSINGLILKFFFFTIHHYLSHLKVIKQLTNELQSKLNLSMENKYLLQMFVLGESLTYYLNALKGNSAVLTKLQAVKDRLNLSPEDTAALEDLVIDHNQCEKQTEIYSSVLSGLMDARGTIINNNMNVLLRDLTIINTVFLPLNLIASIGGMSEFTEMTKGLGWQRAYFIFSLVMLVIGWATWMIIARRISPRSPRQM